MRILLHDYSGHAFPIQLSRSLAKRGHEVLHLYASFFQSPHGALEKRPQDPFTLRIEGLSIQEPFQKYSFFKRRKQEKEYGKVLANRMSQFSPDVVLSGNTPLDSQKVLIQHCRKRGIKFIFWLQDIYSLAIHEILKKKMSFLGSAIGSYYMSQERGLLKQSDKVIAISEDFRARLESWEIPRCDTHVIPNWAVLDELPLMPKDNPWSKKHQLVDKTCFIYSGTLGLKHNPEILLKLADSFKEREEVRIIVISEGLGADWLREKVKELNLNNLIIMNYQAFEDLPYALASAEVLISILNSEAGVYSVPSKVLTYLCVGRPLLLAVPPENLSARLVMESKGGIVVQPDKAQEFLEAAEKLRKDRELRQQMGKEARLFAEKAFNIVEITNLFESLFQGDNIQNSALNVLEKKSVIQ